MGHVLDIAEVGALVGDPARACILTALLDGRAHTAKELAYRARIAPPTASGHLKRLVDAWLLRVVKQGRHRYFRIATPLVVQMIESVSAVAAVQVPPRHRPASRADAALREARLCYDHLAGRIAVEMAHSFQARGLIILDEEGGAITDRGVAYFAARGLGDAVHRRGRRPLFRSCLDWTERRYHIAGQFGADLATDFRARNWIERCPESRTVRFNDAGRRGLCDVFGVENAFVAETGPE